MFYKTNIGLQKKKIDLLIILESKRAEEKLESILQHKALFTISYYITKCIKRGVALVHRKHIWETPKRKSITQSKNQEFVLEWRIKYWYHRFDDKVVRAYPQQSRCEIWPLLSIQALRSHMDLHASTSWMVQNHWTPRMDGRGYLHKIVDPTTIFRTKIHFSLGKKKWMQIQPPRSNREFEEFICSMFNFFTRMRTSPWNFVYKFVHRPRRLIQYH